MMLCSICNERFRPSDIQDNLLVCEVNHRRCSDQRKTHKNRLYRHQIPFEIIATQFHNTQEWHELIELRHQLIKSCIKILKILHEYRDHIETVSSNAMGDASMEPADLDGNGSLNEIVMQLKENDESFERVVKLQTSINRQLEEKNTGLELLRQRIDHMEQECKRLRQCVREGKQTNRSLEESLNKLSNIKKRKRFAKMQATVKQDLIHRYCKQCFLVQRVQSWDEVHSLDEDYFYPRLVRDTRRYPGNEGKDLSQENVTTTNDAVEEQSENSRRMAASQGRGNIRGRYRVVKRVELEQICEGRGTYSKAYIINIGKHLGVPLLDKDISDFYICHNGNLFVRLSTIQKCDELFHNSQSHMRCVTHPCGHKMVLRRLVPLFTYAQILAMVGYRYVYQTDKIYLEPSLSQFKKVITCQDDIDHFLLKRIRSQN